MSGKESGTSLIELIVACLCSSILIIFICEFTNLNVNLAARISKMNHLQSQIQVLLVMFKQELSMAGFKKTHFIKVDINRENLANKCVLFSYLDGFKHEHFAGFRFNSKKNIIERYQEYKGHSNWNCQGSHWFALSADNLKITNLNFNFNKKNGLLNIDLSYINNLNKKEQIAYASAFIVNRKGKFKL